MSPSYDDPPEDITVVRGLVGRLSNEQPSAATLEEQHRQRLLGELLGKVLTLAETGLNVEAFLENYIENLQEHLVYVRQGKMQDIRGTRRHDFVRGVLMDLRESRYVLRELRKETQRGRPD